MTGTELLQALIDGKTVIDDTLTKYYIKNNTLMYKSQLYENTSVYGVNDLLDNTSKFKIYEAPKPAKKLVFHENVLFGNVFVSTEGSSSCKQYDDSYTLTRINGHESAN